MGYTSDTRIWEVLGSPPVDVRTPELLREIAGSHSGFILRNVSGLLREEAQKRFTAFFASTTLAGAFGGLFAYAVSKLDGAAGLVSWRWVFVVGAFLFPSLKVTH